MRITPYYALFKQITSVNIATPYKIAETIMTSDGPRTRFCDGAWSTEENALVELGRKERDAQRS